MSLPLRRLPRAPNRAARLLARLLALVAFVALAGELRAQNLISVPFPNGVIGTRGSSAATANTVKTFATLGISRIFFIQNSTTNQFVELQGNDISGTMRIVRTSGATIDIPASVNWRATSGGNTYLIGLLPRPASPVTLTYAGGSIQITDGSVNGGTSIGGYIAGYAGATLADGGSMNGNAANGVLNDLNAYLATVIQSRPAGPVTVNTLATSSTTPTITGTATLGAGQTLSVVVDGAQYTTSTTPALAVVGTAWSLALTTPLALGTHSVTATITNTDGFTLSDATSSELTIGTGGTVTVGGTFTANAKVYDGTVAATGTTTGLTLSGVAGGHQVTIASVTLAFGSAAVGTGKTVTITGVTLGGTNAGLYTVSLAGAPTATANVTAKGLTISGLSASDKVYDGATTATLAGTASYVGLASGESFAVTGTPAATFATAAVGAAKAVTVTGYTAPSANYTVTQPTGLTASVTAKPLAIGGSLTASDRTYDGTTAATGNTAGLALAGVNGADQVTIASVTLAFGSAAAGAGKTVTITGVTLGGASAAQYAVNLAGAPAATATIAAKALTVAGVTAASRTYDGTTAATLAGTASYTGLVGGETFAVAGTPSASFATAAVGTGKAVTVTGYAAPSANYSVTQPTGLTADVTAKALTIGGTFTASSKAYDGTAAATIATDALTLVGVVGGETVGLTGATAAFADASVGAGKTVSITAATLTGAAATNYTLGIVGAPTTTASITSAGGTVTIAGSFTASDRTYDGTTAATGTTTGLTLAGVSGSDQVTIASVTLAFQSAAAGSNKTVVITGVTLGGTHGAQYAVSLAGAPTATASIAARALTITGLSASDKVYDGATTATLAGTASYAGLASGESHAVAGTPAATFASAAVGAGKAVTVAGYSAPNANYTVAQPAGLAAAITAKPLTIGGSFAASSKTFDGTAAATITTNALTLGGVVGGDAVSLAGVAAAFADASVGAGKTVSLTTASLTGAASSNYTLSMIGAPTTTASITAAGGTLTIAGTFTANDRTYDGTTAATGTTTGLSLVGVAGGHQVTIGSVTLAFASAAAGSGKTVAITGVTLAGANAAQYAVSLAGAPTATATIAARPLTIDGLSAASRPYDGTTAATLAGTPSYANLAPGESFAVAGTPTASFATAAVGTGKAVTVTGYAAPSANYGVTQPTGLAASVTPRPVTVGGAFTASSRTYDGTAAATIATSALAVVGAVGGDALSLTGVTAAFADASVGTAKPVALTAATLAGATSANYALSLAGAPTTTASITSAGGTVTIAGTFTASDRVYDATTAATGSTAGLTLAGVSPSDQVTIASVTLAFQTAAVGTGKTVVIAGVTLGGANAAQYAVSLAGAPTATATITARPLTLGGTFAAASRPYDRTTAATITTNALTLVGAVAGDAVALGAATATFADPAVGASKPVSLGAPALTGASAANYALSLTGAPTTTASITARGVTIGGSFAVADRLYDGTPTAAIGTNALTLVGVIAGDVVGLGGVTARFADATVGAAKPVTIVAAALTGASASQYALSLAGAPTATAAIVAATPPAPPRTVGGSAGDGTLSVSWSLPDAAGCQAITGYSVEVSVDEGRSWTRAALAPAGTTSIVLTGLPNNVPHRVRVAAVNTCGTSAYSAAAGPYVPVGPTRDGSGAPAPVATGTVGVTSGGVPQPVTTEVVQDTLVRLTGEGFALRVRATDAPGAPIPLDSARTLQLEHGGRVAADGSGFAAGTVVTGYLFGAGRTALLLGTATVGADGAFSAALPVPDTLAAGSYTLQVNGVDRTARPRSVGLGVEVVLPPPDLALAATPDQTSPAPGDTVIITLTVTNEGRGPAIDVVIPRAFREPGFVVVRATPVEGSYDTATQTWTIPRIEPNARARMRLTAVVLPPTNPPAPQKP